jgi:hypothetical protein
MYPRDFSDWIISLKYSLLEYNIPRTFSNSHISGCNLDMASIKIGNPSLESFRPSCNPPTLKGWHGGPPITIGARGYS